MFGPECFRRYIRSFVFVLVLPLLAACSGPPIKLYGGALRDGATFSTISSVDSVRGANGTFSASSDLLSIDGAPLKDGRYHVEPGDHSVEMLVTGETADRSRVRFENGSTVPELGYYFRHTQKFMVRIKALPGWSYTLRGTSVNGLVSVVVGKEAGHLYSRFELAEGGTDYEVIPIGATAHSGSRYSPSLFDILLD